MLVALVKREQTKPAKHSTRRCASGQPLSLVPVDAVVCDMSVEGMFEALGCTLEAARASFVLGGSLLAQHTLQRLYETECLLVAC